ncbi:tight adherence protein C [Promicromonospora umidemergens]|uniref:Type II secretion system F family protein n=1 Tax=Promicromonospora umidemergens TaxID=629679 RepID=A0ABP8WQF9_9MICO|nr:type II secretion system F family protein [Promicromonospora umidemergens]MCP2283191.1 tight adherence protein C [Promicromonospora umidemergens]
MTGWAAGALAGLGVALGLLIVLARLRARAVTLDERLAPYLRPRDATSTLLREVSRTSAVVRLLGLHDVGARLERFGSPRAEVRRRLDRAGSAESVDHFRARQVVWTVTGLATGLGLAMLLSATRGAAVIPLAMLVVVAGGCGYVACDQALTTQVRRREERLLAELPTIAELLALAVAAGESPPAALERVASTARGELAGEIRRMVAEVRAGAPVTAALTALADRSGLPPLSRFAEGVVVALERGTPLAEVLRAQAEDVREAGRRSLLEAGGRKEILMMVPVVFLVLPVTVVFAVFPSLATLRIGL